MSSKTSGNEAAASTEVDAPIEDIGKQHTATEKAMVEDKAPEPPEKKKRKAETTGGSTTADSKYISIHVDGDDAIRVADIVKEHTAKKEATAEAEASEPPKKKNKQAETNSGSTTAASKCCDNNNVAIRVDGMEEEHSMKEKGMVDAKVSEPPKNKEKDKETETNGSSATAKSKSSGSFADAVYKIGTKISKPFDGEAYEGEIISYDPEEKYYQIKYSDGDEEEMNATEVKKYRVGLPKVASAGAGKKGPSGTSKDASKSIGKDKPKAAPEKPSASSDTTTPKPKPNKIREFGHTNEEHKLDMNLFVRNPCRVGGGKQNLPSSYGNGGSGKSSFAYLIQRLSDRNYAMRGLCLTGDGAQYTSFSRRGINTKCSAFLPKTNLDDHAADKTILDACHLDMVNHITGYCLLTADNLIKAATPDQECIFLNGYQKEGRSNEHIDPNAIVKVIQTCKNNLKCFALTECVLTNEILAALASCKNLRGLTLYMTEKWSGDGGTLATDAGLASVISSCPELRWLYIDMDKERPALFDDECWMALFNNRSCPNLEVLWVDSWKNADGRRFVTHGSHAAVRSALKERASTLKLYMITPDANIQSRYVIGGATTTDRLKGIVDNRPSP